MLDEYSLEQRASQIFDHRTKEYFAEVLSSYTTGNYRSAVVMLWSVAICDLLFKLQNLVEIYGDATARVILDEISAMQQANEYSPTWEATLVEKVADRTQLLDIAEKTNLLHLQQQRHLAAHPIINRNLELHRPNKDTTRALIRNTLDSLLTKAPILSKKIISELVVDLEQASGILIDDRRLKSYLESKYFNRFNVEVEKEAFRSLWKFVFRLTDESCTKNRAINFKTLRLLFARNPGGFKKIVENDRDYFSNIATEGAPLVLLVHFLSREANLYGLLAGHAKTTIQHIVESNNIDAHCLGWFVSGNLDQHFANLSEWIKGDAHPDIPRDIWANMQEISDTPEWTKKLIRLANIYYRASWSFDEADQRFNESILPLLSKYEIDDLRDLIELIEQNDQTWARRGAQVDHGKVLQKALEEDPAFNTAQYPNFNRSVA